MYPKKKHKRFQKFYVFKAKKRPPKFYASKTTPLRKFEPLFEVFLEIFRHDLKSISYFSEMQNYSRALLYDKDIN